MTLINWYLIVILNEQLVMRNHMGGLKELWQQIEGYYTFEIRNSVRPGSHRPTDHRLHTFSHTSHIPY